MLCRMLAAVEMKISAGHAWPAAVETKIAAGHAWLAAVETKIAAGHALAAVETKILGQQKWKYRWQAAGHRQEESADACIRGLHD